MSADFTVDLEVRPAGGVRGTREMASATRALTEATRQSGEENRRARAATTDLEQAQRRHRATLEQMVQSIRAQNLALAQARTDHASYQQRVEAAAEAKRRATGVVNAFRAAIVALQVAVAALGLGALIRDSVNVALAFDRAQKSLVAATGSQQLAAREMRFVSAEADRLGLVLTDTAQAYAKLSAASRGTSLAGQQTRDIFSAVAETGSILGLRADEMQGALNAIQQMMSKGTVQAEELRGQLGERLPGAFQLSARAMGVTTAELGKMLEGGKVMAADLLPKLADELRRTFGPGLLNAVNSAQANLNRLRNALDQVKAALGEGFLAGFLAGFVDLNDALSAEDLKAAALDLGESIGKAMRTAADVAVTLAKYLEMVKAVLLVIVSLKAASWFVSLAGAIATATGQTLIFKSALSSVAIAGPLAAIGVALLAVIVIMERYISTTRLAHAAEMEKVAKSQEIFGYYQTLKANKVGLTEAEAQYAIEVRKTMEAERTAMAVSLERARSRLRESEQAARYASGFGAEPKSEYRDEVANLEREIQTIDNMLNGLQKEWDRLDQLPTIKLPVDPEKVDKAARKVADLLEGFRRTAEQAERIQAAQERGGAPEVARVTEEIERQNAAYQALHSLEGISAAAKAKLSAIIEGLVGRTQDANRATAESAAETQRSLTFTAAALEAEARLADAKGQTSIASREAAVQAEAEAIAREHQREEDAAYVAGLLQVIRTRQTFLEGIALEIAAVERQIAHASTLRQKRAELAEAQGQDAAATRRLTVEIEAETEARARGVQLGTVWHLLLLAVAAARAQEIALLDQQTAAQRRLNDAVAAQRQARAEFTDWNRQREAAKEYGSEIADILRHYGLLSEATKRMEIREQALAIQRQEGGARTLEQIEAELRGYAAVEETLARVAATIELQAYIIEPGIEAWQRVGETIQSALIDQIIEGNVRIEDLWKSMARTFLQALAEMLKRWILTHKAMQAEAMRTAAINAAAAQGAGANVGGGTGGAAGLAGMAQQAMGMGGGAGGAGMGTAASLGAVAAIYAAVYLGASAWVKSHKEYSAEVTFKLNQDVGALIASVRGDTRNSNALTKQIQEMGRSIADWIASLGGAIEWVGTLGDNAVTVGRKGRGKDTAWFVEMANGVREWFNSQEEAFSFAMVQALKQAEISGLDPIVAAAIRNSTAKTMEEFQRSIADAVKVASFGRAEATADFRGVTAEMDRLRASMRELIGTGAELYDALARINAQEILLLQSQRDAITGKQRTADEEYQMRLLEARAWNAEREVRLNSIALQILEIKTKIENYRGTRVLIDGGGAGGDKGGLVGLGKTFAWLAGVVVATSDVLVSSGDAQLDALNGFLKSLEDLYNALKAMPPIDPSEVPYPTSGKGGGGGAGDGGRKQGRLDLLREVEGWGLTDVGRQLQDTSSWFDAFKKSLKDLGFSAAKQAELLAAARDELERRRQEIKATQVGSSRDFINAGTAAGGPLLKGLDENRKTQLALIAANRDLQKQGLLTQKEMRDLNRAIHEAGKRQREQMITSAANQLFLDLYQLLGDEAAAAQLRFDLTVMELELRKEELRLAMLTAGYTEERMNAILTPLGILIQRVKDAGPGIFGGEGNGGTGGVQNEGPAGKVWMHGRWVSSSEQAAAQSAADKLREANNLLAQYRDQGKSEYALAVERVTSDFEIIRAALGNTGEVAAQFTAAMDRLRVQFLEGVQDFYDALRKGDISGLNVEQQYGAAMAQYQKLLLAVQGGDLSQANALAQAGQDLVRLAGQMWGTSTGGFAELRDAILEQLRGILGITSPQPAQGPNFAAGGTGVAPLRPGDNRIPPTAGDSRLGEKQIKATEEVTEAVSFSGRKLERSLARLETLLEALITKVANDAPTGSLRIGNE